MTHWAGSKIVFGLALSFISLTVNGQVFIKTINKSLK